MTDISSYTIDTAELKKARREIAQREADREAWPDGLGRFLHQLAISAERIGFGFMPGLEHVFIKDVIRFRTAGRDR